jgi:hypothetical protein
MLDAVNNSRKQRGRPFKSGVSGNPGGRPKGSRNKRTRALLEAAQVGGELPLDYMLAVMRDPKAQARRRDDMAKAAAPYVHSRLASVEQPGPQTKPAITGIEVVFVVPKPRADRGLTNEHSNADVNALPGVRI